MSKKLTNYRSTNGFVIVKVSPGVYNGKYVSTSKNLGLSKRAGDLCSSLKKTIESVNNALRESEKIIQITKNGY